MFQIQYRVFGEYTTFSYRETLRSAKREANNLYHYAGWSFIRIVTPQGKPIQTHQAESTEE